MSKKLTCFVVGLAFVASATPAIAADPGQGYILFEYWYDIGAGTAVADLTGSANYPDNPSESEWLTSFFAPEGVTAGGGVRDNYGIRGRAYVYPPQTGDYTFWVAGDDYCELWLSTDENPVNRTMIAEVPGWTPAQDWLNTGGGASDADAQESDPIPLEQGKRYYIEALMKEAGGGESIGVAWGGPGIGAGPTLLEGKYCAAILRDPEPMFQARNPEPADGAVGVIAPLLTWDVGVTAQWHDLYFGTDPNPPLVGRQPFALYYHIPGLEPGAIYYWRVNEIEADAVTIHEGALWTFVAQSLTAYYPNPADAAPSVSPTTVLTWEAGRGAVTHHLYLSTDADAVAQRAAAADQGVLEEATFDPGGLQGGVTYYWAVDETSTDGSIQTGEVWSFTTFILVDDFESYDDDIDGGTAVFQTWIDGFENLTTSFVGYEISANGTFNETTNVHGGGQAMPVDYNNINSPFYAEAERTWPSPQDWTVGGANTLTIWFRGAPQRFLQNGPDSFTVSASGVDIWDTADEFRFVYKRLNGDGSIVARVDSIVNTNGWAKAGVMIREGLFPGDKHAGAVATPGSGVSFQRRVFSNDVSLDTTQAGITPPHWVKITRTGNTFKAEHSPDGAAWTSMGTDAAASSDDMTMMSNVYIGLCVTSHDAARTTTAEFSEVATTGSVSGQWQVLAIGAAHTANDLESMYVKIADSAGRSTTVPHPDAEAVFIDEWTPWYIPLADLAPVNPAAIKKMTIGFGDDLAPQPSGHGLVLFDDIRVENIAPDTDAEE